MNIEVGFGEVGSTQRIHDELVEVVAEMVDSCFIERSLPHRRDGLANKCTRFRDGEGAFYVLYE